MFENYLSFRRDLKSQQKDSGGKDKLGNIGKINSMKTYNYQLNDTICRNEQGTT